METIERFKERFERELREQEEALRDVAKKQMAQDSALLRLVEAMGAMLTILERIEQKLTGNPELSGGEKIREFITRFDRVDYDEWEDLQTGIRYNAAGQQLKPLSEYRPEDDGDIRNVL